MPTATRRPVYGYPVLVELPERACVLWWGPDEDDDDLLACADGRVLAWPDLDACLAYVRARDWDEAAPDDAPDEQDLRPAAAWVEGATAELHAPSALAVWNLASDVASSTGTSSWDDDDLDGACHEKLTLATVPWLAGRDEYVPTWTPDEQGHLRRRLAEALTLVRAALV